MIFKLFKRMVINIVIILTQTMEWKEPRRPIRLKTLPYDKTTPHKVDLGDREQVLKECQYACCYCGGVYKKYLIRIQVYKENYLINCQEYDIDVCCPMCHLVTHLNTGQFHEMEVHSSKMTQKEIIHKTAEFIQENSRVPHPHEVDPDIKSVPISILEFIHIINSYKKKPLDLKLYRIFFSPAVKYDFILNNYPSNYMFVDDPNSGSGPSTMKIPEDKDPKALQLIDKFFS